MKTIDLSRGVPDPQSFPIDKLQALTVSALARDANRMLQYGPAFGYMPLREFIASWFDCAAPNVLVGNGSLEIFDFLCEAYLKPGDVVFVERPTYDRAVTTLKQHGVTIVGIDVHEGGICLDVFERELQRHTPKLVYLIPDFQNPTGVCMTLDARRTMIRLARQHRFLIVEDGPYGFLRYTGDPIPSIHSMAPDITLHLSSFTKLISPGVRVGFLVAPADVVQRVARVAERHYITPGVFAQGVVAAWCEDGQLPLQLDRLRRLYGPRLDVCVQAIERYLPGRLFVRPEGGFFTSVRLGAHIDESSLLAAAAEAGLALSSGNAFFDAHPGYQFLRLPFCALVEADIVEGIQRLGDVVSHLNMSARLKNARRNLISEV
ncbi:2-aminoadipate transaminase [Paraburkholderia nemoris]|uniref:aminotransferase-like domain-containing protein n=1 Tax=Paraburkholderia nemoris TaxID=2793076 RepID=UPI00190D0C39|nr:MULTISPECIES: PLP-dependent aminotransferase family protein [Paraburkholderia]MBK3787045.1 PLP-dependent aminotransferase family protein [Paraburkholderia aspalathi]CAE6866004.1 2-aminoadipate transaminase [Paraburkholderia nemoris]